MILEPWFQKTKEEKYHVEKRKVMLDEKIYNYIVTYIQKHGYAPSYREIADEVDVASTSTVHAYLQELFEYGLLEKDCEKNVPRAIRVPGYEFVRKEKGKRDQGSLRCDILNSLCPFFQEQIPCEECELFKQFTAYMQDSKEAMRRHRSVKEES